MNISVHLPFASECLILPLPKKKPLNKQAKKINQTNKKTQKRKQTQKIKQKSIFSQYEDTNIHVFYCIDFIQQKD